jgi:hypothetical protein
MEGECVQLPTSNSSISSHTCLCSLRSGPWLQRDDLKGEAIQGGLVESLMQVVRYHKAEQTTCMAMGCLMELALDRDSWPRIIQCGGSLLGVGGEAIMGGSILGVGGEAIMGGSILGVGFLVQGLTQSPMCLD